MAGKRKLNKRVRELERVMKHEADSLTRLYARVERLEVRSGQFKTVPLPLEWESTDTETATLPKLGRNWSATLEIIG